MQDVIDIEVTPLSSACGAEIKGIDVTRPLSEAEVGAIKEAWAKHLVGNFQGYGEDVLPREGVLPGTDDERVGAIAEIDVHGIQLRIHAPSHASRPRQQVLRPRIGTNAYGDALPDRPVFLDFFFIHVG